MDISATTMVLAEALALVMCLFVMAALTHERQRLRKRLAKYPTEVEQLKAQLEETDKNYRQAYKAYQVREELLDDSQKAIEKFRKEARESATALRQVQSEISRRATFRNQMYRIVTIGLPKTGKTSLTLKWANPLWELKNVQGTSFDRYTRTVSSVVSPETNVMVNHTFEVYDFGGERIVDAHDTLVVDDIHGILFVVDLANNGEEQVSLERVKEHIQEFQPTSLRFFFQSPRITKTCRTVVLFINKSDSISGTPAQVEQIARDHFSEMIGHMEGFSDHVDFKVLVGSAVSGHNLHKLMPHFVRQLLPDNAFDEQLMQKQNTRDLPEQFSVIDVPGGGDDWDDKTAS